MIGCIPGLSRAADNLPPPVTRRPYPAQAEDILPIRCELTNQLYDFAASLATEKLANALTQKLS